MGIEDGNNVVYEKPPKIKIIDLKEFLKKKEFLPKSINRARDYVKKTYGNSEQYVLADFDYEKYLLQLPPDEVPTELKDGRNYYFFDFRPGSVNSPYVYWEDGKLCRGENIEFNSIDDWNENSCVLLLEE